MHRLSRIFAGCRCLLVMLMLSPVSLAAAQEADYTVDISREFLRRTLESIIGSSISTMPGVIWNSGERVAMERDGYVHVTANLLLDTHDFLAAQDIAVPEILPNVIEVEVSFDLFLHCVTEMIGQQPELAVAVNMVDVTVGFSLAIDILVGPAAPVLAAIGNDLVERLGNISEKVDEKIQARIKEEFDLGTLESCPWIELHEDCSHTLVFGGPNSCTNGDTKTTQCGIGQIFYLCVNGEWVFQEMTCH